MTTPMDPRVRARRIEVARRTGRRRFRRALVLALVVSALGAAVAITRSSLLDVDTIEVRGADRTGDDAVRQVAGIDRGRAMTSVDLDRAADRVEALPWIDSTSVRRRWPGAIQVEVTERRAVARAGDGPGAVLVDAEARILGAVGAGDADLPLAGPDPVEGLGSLLPPVRRPVVALLATLPDSLRAEVAEGTTETSGLGLVLHDGITVHLGDATRLRAKSDAVAVLLAEADRPTIATIDVAVPGAPALTRRPTETRDAPSAPDAPLTNDEAGGA